MNIKILAKFMEQFGDKDIDKKFDTLIAFKKLYYELSLQDALDEQGL